MSDKSIEFALSKCELRAAHDMIKIIEEVLVIYHSRNDEKKTTALIEIDEKLEGLVEKYSNTLQRRSIINMFASTMLNRYRVQGMVMSIIGHSHPSFKFLNEMSLLILGKNPLNSNWTGVLFPTTYSISQSIAAVGSSSIKYIGISFALFLNDLMHNFSREYSVFINAFSSVESSIRDKVLILKESDIEKWRTKFYDPLEEESITYDDFVEYTEILKETFGSHKLNSIEDLVTRIKIEVCKDLLKGLKDNQIKEIIDILEEMIIEENIDMGSDGDPSEFRGYIEYYFYSTFGFEKDILECVDISDVLYRGWKPEYSELYKILSERWSNIKDKLKQKEYKLIDNISEIVMKLTLSYKTDIEDFKRATKKFNKSVDTIIKYKQILDREICFKGE